MTNESLSGARMLMKKWKVENSKQALPEEIEQIQDILEVFGNNGERLTQLMNNQHHQINASKWTVVKALLREQQLLMEKV